MWSRRAPLRRSSTRSARASLAFGIARKRARRDELARRAVGLGDVAGEREREARRERAPAAAVFAFGVVRLAQRANERREARDDPDDARASRAHA